MLHFYIDLRYETNIGFEINIGYEINIMVICQSKLLTFFNDQELKVQFGKYV